MRINDLDVIKEHAIEATYDGEIACAQVGCPGPNVILEGGEHGQARYFDVDTLIDAIDTHIEAARTT